MGDEKSNPSFKKLKDFGWGIQPMGPSPLGGDQHETFKVDSEGNLSGDHTTIQIPGGQRINIKVK